MSRFWQVTIVFIVVNMVWPNSWDLPGLFVPGAIYLTGLLSFYLGDCLAYAAGLDRGAEIGRRAMMDTLREWEERRRKAPLN